MRNVLLFAFLLGACVEPVTYDAPDGGGAVDAAEPDAGPPIDAPDPDVPPLVVSVDALELGEASVAWFDVRLRDRPADGPLLVTLTPSSDAIGIKPEDHLLIFPDDDAWSEAQRVFVVALPDDDAEDGTAEVTIAAAAPLSASAVVSVAVTDDDELEIAATPATALDLGEGATETVRVALTARPLADVHVAITSDPTLILSDAELVFGPDDWDLPQTFDVTGAEDDDLVDDAATLSLSAAETGAVTIDVMITDDDQQGVDPSTTSMAIVEGGSAPLHIRLQQQPSAELNVTIATTSAGVAASPSTLTFDAADWNVPQTVTIAAAPDNDTADSTAAVTLSAPGCTERTVSIAIDDDDVPDVVATPSPLAIAENGSAALAVRLAYRPATTTSVAVSSLAPAIASTATTTLTFEPATYATPQTITVTAADDPDAVAGSTAIRLQALALGVSRDVPVAVADDDQLTIATSASSVAVIEGSTTTLLVSLTAQPTATTTVTLSASTAAELSVSPATLTFTTSSWSTAQAVSITGQPDLDLVHESGTLTLTAAGLPTRTLTTTVTDDDVQAVVAANTAVVVGEGLTTQVGVSLRYQPSGTVTVAVASSATGAATVTPATLSFTAADYATPKTVTISGVQDMDLADATATIALTAAGATSGSIAVTVDDDDVQAVVVASGSVTVGEDASTQVGVSLRYQPSSTVTVSLASNATAVATVTPATLTFTSADYATPKPVTIAGVADADLADGTAVIAATATGATSAAIAVTVDDDDTQEIVVASSSVTVAEGATTLVGVVLRYQPSSATTVSVSSSSASATATPSSFEFTAADYNVPRFVTIGGVQDVDLVDGAATIRLTSAGVADATIAVTVDDDDQQAVIASPSSVTVGEGGSVTTGVRLAYQPSGSVSVAVAVGNAGVASVTPGTLAFTASDWSTPKAITITGVQDADSLDGSTSISLSSAGATAASVTVAVTDDDVAELVGLSLSYGGAPITNPISPAVAPTTLAYAASVGRWLQRVQLTAAVQPAGATLTINGSPATPGSPTSAIDLAIGTNPIPIVVSNGATTRTYTLTITRGGTVIQEAYVKPPSVGAGDQFGTYQAAWGDTIVVGAPLDDGPTDTLTNSGAAYVLVRSGTSWVVAQVLRASNAGAGDGFGRAVAIHGDTIVVGADTEDGVGDAMTDAGAAYVFVRAGGVWTEQAVLRGSTGAAGDCGGRGVAVWGDVVAVGAECKSFNTGAVYMFRRAGTTWAETQIVTPDNPSQNDHFGEPLQLWEDTLLVSADLEDTTAGDSGAAYVFVHDVAVDTWEQEQMLKASNAGTSDKFGWRVALMGDTAVVAANDEDSSATTILHGSSSTNNTSTNSGAVYVFERSGTTWTEKAYVKPPNTGTSDNFGQSIGLWGDTLAVRAIYEDSQTRGVFDAAQTDDLSNNAGAVYVFTRTGSTWSFSRYLKSSNSDADDNFGDGVIVWGDTVIAGCDHEDSASVSTPSDNSAVEAGAAYVFR